MGASTVKVERFRRSLRSLSNWLALCWMVASMERMRSGSRRSKSAFKKWAAMEMAQMGERNSWKTSATNSLRTRSISRRWERSTKVISAPGVPRSVRVARAPSRTSMRRSPMRAMISRGCLRRSCPRIACCQGQPLCSGVALQPIGHKAWQKRRPRTSCACSPVMRSASRLKAQMRQSSSMATIAAHVSCRLRVGIPSSKAVSRRATNSCNDMGRVAGSVSPSPPPPLSVCTGGGPSVFFMARYSWGPSIWPCSSVWLIT